MRLRILFLLVPVFYGCAPSPTGAPTPTISIVRIGLSPATMAWQDELQNCSQTIPGTFAAIYEQAAFDPGKNANQLDFFLQIDGSLPSSLFVTQLGWEEIVWITNTSNPIDNLTIQQITEIYAGMAINSSKGDDESLTGLEIWVYPQGDALAEFLERTIPVSKTFLSAASMAPDPGAMIQAVAENPKALGYVPRSWLIDVGLGQDVHPVNLVDPEEDGQRFAIEVFAVSTQEPGSAGREVLLCFRKLVFETP